MSRVILVTGGARSGKSNYALRRAGRYESKAFLATAVPFDAEMRERIDKHRIERGDAFFTVEEPVDLAGALLSMPRDTNVAVIDCLTVWLGNLMRDGDGNIESYPPISAFIEVLKRPGFDLIIVSNEVGMGIVPENAMARRFRDLAGRVNADVARIADEVVLLVSGVALVIKGDDG